MSQGTAGGPCGCNMTEALEKMDPHHHSCTEARTLITMAASLPLTSRPASLLSQGLLVEAGKVA